MFCESRPFTLVLSLEMVEKQHLHEKLSIPRYQKHCQTVCLITLHPDYSTMQTVLKTHQIIERFLFCWLFNVSYSYRLRSNVFICLDKIILSVSPNCTLRLARTAQVWLIRQKQIGLPTSWSLLPKMIPINTSGLIAALSAWSMCTSHKNEMA